MSTNRQSQPRRSGRIRTCGGRGARGGPHQSPTLRGGTAAVEKVAAGTTIRFAPMRKSRVRGRAPNDVRVELYLARWSGKRGRVNPLHGLR